MCLTKELSGGRQVDGAIASLDALALIMKDPEIIEAQRSGKLTVFFDSGIRTGCDIVRRTSFHSSMKSHSLASKVKAIALGANAVLLGRPYVYGLCLDGQKGVEAVIKSVLADLDITMGLAGNVSIDEMRGKRFRVLMNNKQLWECL
jgi:lactate 2-monooxygenase